MKLKHLIEKPDAETEKYLYDRWRTVNRWERFLCRLKNHPYMIDYDRCSNCGDKKY